jgi:hypothetical protein
MSKHQQNGFPRLAIVGPTEKSTTRQPPAARWWGPQRSRVGSLNPATRTSLMPSQAIRMAVMPTLSRNLCFVAVARMWNLLRGYFATERRGGAVVLSFRRHASSAPGSHRAMAPEHFAGRKPNGSIRWNHDCEVAPQEGGRG